MASKVNLDALIFREDFQVVSDKVATKLSDTITIESLKKGSFFYSTLRKPDFQRETSEWNKERIAQFVKSFMDGDLIPAVILWNSSGYNFVIDGAHRLSALIAWVQDDYGDGEMSQRFFGYEIPVEQLNVAEQTRRFVDRVIGSYQDHVSALSRPQLHSPQVVEQARWLASIAVQLQWVTGDAAKAEASFLRINQQAVPINKTELKLVQARNKPDALASRAIIRSGTGHKYWSKFESGAQSQIIDCAKDIHSLLFTPELNRPIKTLDLPAAGRSYSSHALPLVYEMVNIANNRVSEKSQELSEDMEGLETIRFLKNTLKLAQRITGTHPSSLGLHPAIYFYNRRGLFQPVAFYAMALWIKEIERKNRFSVFTDHRRKFEEFLLAFPSLPGRVNVERRGGYKGYKSLQELYECVLDALIQGRDIVATLKSDNRFAFLKFDDNRRSAASSSQRSFSREVKSAAFILNALENPLRCKICQGLIYSESMTVDHAKRKADGGTGDLDNAQLAHPYCNSTHKN